MKKPKIDFSFDLDKLLTKEHFNKTAFAAAILFSVTVFFDILEILSGASIVTGGLITIGFMFYYTFLKQKERYQQQINKVRKLNLSNYTIKELKDEMNRVGAEGISYKELGMIKDDQELTWRDLWS